MEVFEKCQKCGKEITRDEYIENARFCKPCFNTEMENLYEKKQAEKKSNFALFIFVVVITIIVFFVILSFNNSSNNGKSDYQRDFEQQLKTDPSTWTDSEKENYKDYMNWLDEQDGD